MVDCRPSDNHIGSVRKPHPKARRRHLSQKRGLAIPPLGIFSGTARFMGKIRPKMWYSYGMSIFWFVLAKWSALWGAFIARQVRAANVATWNIASTPKARHLYTIPHHCWRKIRSRLQRRNTVLTGATLPNCYDRIYGSGDVLLPFFDCIFLMAVQHSICISSQYGTLVMTLKKSFNPQMGGLTMSKKVTIEQLRGNFSILTSEKYSEKYRESATLQPLKDFLQMLTQNVVEYKKGNMRPDDQSIKSLNFAHYTSVDTIHSILEAKKELEIKKLKSEEKDNMRPDDQSKKTIRSRK